MSSEQDNGIKFDIKDYELVILVSKLAPDKKDEPYDWDKSVRVFMNSRETNIFSLELELNGDLPCPVLLLNRVTKNENSKV